MPRTRLVIKGKVVENVQKQRGRHVDLTLLARRVGRMRARLEGPPRGVVHFSGSRGVDFAVFFYLNWSANGYPH